MAKDSIVTFCPRIGPRSACLVMTNCPIDGRGQGHVTSSFFGKYVLISRKRCKTQIYNGRLIVSKKKTPTHIVGYKLRNSCLILIIFDTEIPDII